MTPTKLITSCIGGYFELELPPQKKTLHEGLQQFQSARAAFLALINAGKPRKIWIPKFICNAMLAPLEKSRVDYQWYDLTNDLEVSHEVKLSNGEWLLYVNYFGICGKHIDSLIKRYDPTQIVLDNSQAFFSEPNEQVLATIYSPRKFFGVPDGGLLHSGILVPSPLKFDSDSFSRMEHLIRRLGDSPEAGYSDYKLSEDSLADTSPKGMSKLSERILFSVDFENARIKRTNNFDTLRKLLEDDSTLINQKKISDIPLCYPFRTNNERMREILISNRIFTPTYWNDAVPRLTKEQAEMLVSKTIPLPIDQRYDVDDMKIIAETIKSIS